jgi:hypothetical protein
MYFYLVYISVARKPMSESELLGLLEQSRGNNFKLHITGLLVYMETVFSGQIEGRFIQMLEGPEAVVRIIFDRIKTDERHHGVLLLTTGIADTRQFEQWSMAFKSFDAATAKNAPGFSELTRHLFSNTPFMYPNNAVSYLLTFYHINNS